MDLLSKFEAVEVKSDTRISEADKAFCEAQQAAYQAAKTSLMELKFFWEDMETNQMKLLEGTDTQPTMYLTSSSRLNLSPEEIERQLKLLHNVLIEQLVHYFNGLYHVTVSYSEVVEALLPEEPEKYRSYDEESIARHKEEKEAYETALLTLSLDYTDVLNQIFAQMAGRGLLEQAVYELKAKCHKAAWHSYQKTARYELKKDTLRYPEYGCSYDSGYRRGYWHLCDGMKDILRGIAHYETGSFSYIPSVISNLFSYSLDYDLAEFYNCKKVKQLKMFKNGRVDIKFADEEHARKFTEDYLGLVY